MSQSSSFEKPSYVHFEKNGYRSVPLRLYLGFSAVWVIWLMLFLELSFAGAFSEIIFSQSRYTNYFTRIGMVICFVIAILLFKKASRSKVERFFTHKGFFLAAACTFAFGIFINYSSYVTEGPASGIDPALQPVGGLFEGIGFALLIVPWVLKLEKLPYRQSLFILSGSFVIGTLGYHALTLLPEPLLLVEQIIYMALPFLSLLCLRENTRITTQERLLDENTHPTEQRNQISIMTFIVVVICSAVYGYVQTGIHELVPEHLVSTKLISAIITLIAGLAITLICGRNPQKNIKDVFKISLPITLVGFLILPFCSGSFILLPLVIIFLGYAWFSLCVLIVAVMASKFLKTSLSLAFFIIFIAEAVGNVCGNYSAVLILENITTNDVFFYQVTMVLVALLFFAIGFLFDKALSTEWETVNTSLKENDSEHELREDIANTYALSSREKEVFHLLARGKRAAEIADILVISTGTTRNHIHNIYEKLDVHSYHAMMNEIKKHSASYGNSNR